MSFVFLIDIPMTDSHSMMSTHSTATSAPVSHPIRVFVKCLAGDSLSVECSLDDSLLQLKRQIAAAAATQLGLDWPVHMQQLIRMSNAAERDGEIGDDVKKDDMDGGVLRSDSDDKSLNSLRIGDGDVLALLIEEQVRSAL
jgi:hypothetical protein